MSAFAKPCRLEPWPIVYKINNLLDSTIIKSGDCDQQTTNAVLEFLSSASGEMPAEKLNQMFKYARGLDVDFTRSFQVKDLKEVIASKLGLKEAVIANLSSLYGQASLNLSAGQDFAVECADCERPGERNFKLTIDGKVLWFSGSVKVKRQGLKLLSDISPFGEDLTAAIVEPVSALGDGTSEVFNDLERIRFYRPSKPLPKGAILTRADLIPKTLVKFNQDVQVLLQGKNISLKTRATSRQNGKYGDLIKVHNPKTNKTLTGKVVDFNKVIVEL